MHQHHLSGGLAAAALCLFLCLFSSTTSAASIKSCESVFDKLRCLYNIEESAARNITSSTEIYSGDNKCGLGRSTCCSPLVEYYFREDVTRFYQDKLFHLLDSTITPCTTINLINVTIYYINQSESVLLQGLNSFLPAGVVDNNSDIIYNFFNYLRKGIRELDLCQLNNELQSMYFFLYSLVFNTRLNSNNLQFPPHTPGSNFSFHQCFYQYFRDKQQSFISQEYARLNMRYQLFIHYLRGLHTANQVLKDLVKHTLSSDCQLNLLQLTHCSACSGESSVMPCPSHCINVMRGCLVDIKELSTVYTEFYQILKTTSNLIENSYDPYGALTVFQSKMITFIFTTNNGYEQIKSDLESRCNTQFVSNSGKRKRSLSPRSLHRYHKISKRQSADFAMSVLKETATCPEGINNILGQLDSLMCSGNVANNSCDCWNGTTTSSYNYVTPNGDRLSQLNNPELLVRSDTGLSYLQSIAKLKNVTESLRECTANVNDCSESSCSLQLPTGDDYNLDNVSTYELFLTTGYPSPTPIDTSNCTSTSLSIEVTTCGHRSLPTVGTTSTTVVQSTSTTVLPKPTQSNVETTSFPNSGGLSICSSTMSTVSVFLLFVIALVLA